MMSCQSICIGEDDDTLVSATVVALLFFLHVRRILGRKRSRNYSEAAEMKLPPVKQRDFRTSSHSSCEWRVRTPDIERVSTRALLAAWILIHTSWFMIERAASSEPRPACRWSPKQSGNFFQFGCKWCSRCFSDRYWSVNNDLFVDLLGESVYLEWIVLVGSIYQLFSV